MSDILSGSTEVTIQGHKLTLEIQAKRDIIDFSFPLNRPDIFGKKLKSVVKSGGTPSIDVKAPVEKKPRYLKLFVRIPVYFETESTIDFSDSFSILKYCNDNDLKFHKEDFQNLKLEGEGDIQSWLTIPFPLDLNSFHSMIFVPPLTYFNSEGTIGDLHLLSKMKVKDTFWNSLEPFDLLTGSELDAYSSYDKKLATLRDVSSDFKGGINVLINRRARNMTQDDLGLRCTMKID